MPAATTTPRAATKRTNPRDYTGTQKAKAEAGVKEEQEARAAEMALAAEIEAQHRANDVVDYSEGGYAAPAPEQPTPVRPLHPDLVEVEETEEVEVGPRVVTIRVNSKIEQMVYGRTVLQPAHVVQGPNGPYTVDAQLGALQFYDFEEGVQYRVPIELARHLDELGYLWH